MSGSEEARGWIQGVEEERETERERKEGGKRRRRGKIIEKETKEGKMEELHKLGRKSKN